MKEFTITAENEGQRFDKYLHRILAESNMSFIYKMLRKKNFVLNGKKADGGEILKSGDSVKIFLSDETYEKFRTKTAEIRSLSNNNLKKLNSDGLSKVKADNNKKEGFILKENIVYEDENIILINKPTGILSQKAKADDISINEYLIDYLLETKQINAEKLIQYKPSVINRLDRNTSGLIIAAKSLKAARLLSEDLKTRNISKYYMCITVGRFDKNGTYTGYISKDNETNTVRVNSIKNNKDDVYIETGYESLNSNNELSLVKVHLITGKSHQIRAHLKYLGYPILGDPKYGIKSINKKYNEKMQLLHAYRIEFPVYSKEYGFDFSGKAFECRPEFMKRYSF